MQLGMEQTPASDGKHLESTEWALSSGSTTRHCERP